MKPAWLPLTALTAFLVTLVPKHPAPAPHLDGSAHRADSRGRSVGLALGHLESWVTEMKSDQQISSAAGRSSGNLWIEVNKLKQTGQDVRRIEWHISELEESLRNPQRDASGKRHILDNLELEMEALKRRGR